MTLHKVVTQKVVALTAALLLRLIPAAGVTLAPGVALAYVGGRRGRVTQAGTSGCSGPWRPSLPPSSMPLH